MCSSDLQSIRTHFAHESLRDCMAIFENESPEHLGNKEALYHWVKKDNQVALEYSLPEIQQIADVLVNEKTSSGGSVQSLISKAFRR